MLDQALPVHYPAPRQLGSCDVLSLEEAREKARGWLKLIAARGRTPLHANAHYRNPLRRKRANSFAAVFDDFVRKAREASARARDVERYMRKEFVIVWGKRPVGDIGRQDVLSVIRVVKQRGAPSHARICSAMRRRFFDWSIDQRCYGISQIHVPA